MPQEIQDVAYVLKRFFPYRQKIALLTRSNGRINAIIKQQDMCARLWPGMLITCDLCNDGERWFMGRGMIYAAPEHVWIHHVLELCYYFIPLDSPCPEIFMFLKQCNTLTLQSVIFEDRIQAVIKKICVMKFLSLVGFYAHDEICRYLALFQELSDPFVDFADRQKVNFLMNKLLLLNDIDMDLWIVRCLKSHPMFKMFKTVGTHYHCC